MKKFIALLLLTICITARGQYYNLPIGSGNPNNINLEDNEYPFSLSDTTWSILLNGGKANPSWSPIASIPFPFIFNGDTVNTFKVSTSGVLTFDINTSKPVPSSHNTSLPSSNIPDQSICVWGISGKGSNDYLITKTFGTTPNRQLWVSFSSYSIDDTYSTHWTHWSIVLEETSNQIYIVDQRTNGTTPKLTLGIQIDNLNAIEISGSPNIGSISSNNAAISDNKFYTFVPGFLPSEDANLTDLIIPEYQFDYNGPFNLLAAFGNDGADTIKTISFGFSVNNGTSQTYNVLNTDLSTFVYDTLNIGSWNPSHTGTYYLKLWINTINSNIDANNSNDTIYKTVNIVDNSYKRVPLLEMMTSSTSIPAKNINQHVQDIFTDNGIDITYIKYPMNWPGAGDPYYTSEASDRRQYYNVNTIDQLQIDGGWSKIGGWLSQNVIDERFDTPSLVQLTTNFWISGQQINIETSIIPLEDVPGNSNLYIAIFETQTTQNAKNNGETKFYHLMKKMLPNANGVAIGPLSKGVSSQHNYSYTFNGSYRLPTNASNPINHASEHSVENFANLGVVVWIQDETNKEVLQSQYATNTISLEESLNEKGFIMYPNPANALLNFKFDTKGEVRLSIYNSLGQELIEKKFTVLSKDQSHTLSIKDLSSGIYHVFVKIDDTIIGEKLFVD